MAETEETAAQKQARIRRQKREAKISGNAEDRLKRITAASGRDPDKVKIDAPSPARTPQPEQQRSQNPIPPSFGTDDATELRMQQEYMRTLLGGTAGLQEAQDGTEAAQAGQEDPMMKMMMNMLGGAGGADHNNPGGLPFSPDDISGATGLPPALTKMFMGQQKVPRTPAQEKNARLWKVIHSIFSLLAGVYLMFVLHLAKEKYGAKPPAPPTFRNPFLLFVTGEALIHGTRLLTTDRREARNTGSWIQISKGIGADGCILIFTMGLAAWWSGSYS